MSHFGAADIPAFADFKDLQRRLASIQRTFVSVYPFKVSLDFDDEPVQLHVELRDSLLVTPGGSGSKSLEIIGEMIGIGKIRLSDDPDEESRLKSNMKDFRDSDWELFKKYAITDARICCKYYEQIFSETSKLTGRPKAPKTLASIGSDLLLKNWAENGLRREDMLGVEDVIGKVWDEKKKCFTSSKRTVLRAKCQWREDFVSETYHGGRNEQMWFGPSYESDWYDYDLKSAYPTAMALIEVPLWDDMYLCDDVTEFEPTTLGFAHVEFTFPDHIRYPTLPVRTDNGLVFPLEGESYCAAPEIALAVRLGAKVTIKEGWIVPTKKGQYVFFDFIKRCLETRSQYPKGSLKNLLWKELGNSTYGKTAQGLRPKRVYEMRNKESRQQQKSKITNCFYASFTTSYVRAVLGEIMNSIPDDRMVFSCTTDGFITDATPEELKAISNGLLSDIYGCARQRLTGSYDLLEIKHQVRRLLGWTTRGQATLVPGDTGRDASTNIILAKGGISVPYHRLGTWSDNDYIVRLFWNRKPNTKTRIEPFTSIRHMVELDADLVRVKHDKRLNMEFDWKRKPFAAGMDSTCDHLVFSTTPWQSVGDFIRVREQWDIFNRPDRTCLKTVEDYARFATHANSRSAIEEAAVKSGRLSKDAPDVIELRKSLCSAWRQSQAGLSWERGKAAEFAQVLTTAGLPTERSHVEYGKERPFISRSVPLTTNTRRIVEKLRSVYPALDCDALFIQLRRAKSLEVEPPAKCPHVSKCVCQTSPVTATEKVSDTIPHG